MKNDKAVYIPAVHPGTPISSTDAWRTICELIQRYPFLEPVSPHLRRMRPGWVPLFSEYCSKLSRLLAQFSGCEFCLIAVNSTDAGLIVVANGGSDAIHGLARKYHEKSRRTCTRCGAAGKRYSIDTDKRRPLCPACAAPFLLNADLSTLDEVSANSLGARPFVVRHVIPTPLRPAFNLWVGNRPVVRTDSGMVLGVYPWDFVAWTKSLAPLRKKVEKLVKERLRE